MNFTSGCCSGDIAWGVISQSVVGGYAEDRQLPSSWEHFVSFAKDAFRYGSTVIAISYVAYAPEETCCPELHYESIAVAKPSDFGLSMPNRSIYSGWPICHPFMSGYLAKSLELQKTWAAGSGLA